MPRPRRRARQLRLPPVRDQRAPPLRHGHHGARTRLPAEEFDSASRAALPHVRILHLRVHTKCAPILRVLVQFWNVLEFEPIR